jgi:ABC-type uncharacterized transport system permease subunit
MNKAASNEQLKLLANYLNALAAAFVSVGLIGPLFALFYGIVAAGVTATTIAAGIMVCLFMSAALHVAGRAILGGIQE